MGTYFDPFWIFVATVFRIQRGKSKRLEALKLGLDQGMNFIDTAELYRSETIVAEAISGRKRDELFIATKVWSNHLRPDSLIKACKQSLKKLNTSYIDLYQIHFPNSRIPISETMGAMEKLVDDGLIRAIGISNFSYDRMIAAEEALKKHELSSTQMKYNLADRGLEKDILPHCEKENIAVMPYFPLAHGKLAKSGASTLSDVASSHSSGEAKWSTSQVALSWLVAKSPVIFPIPRASNPSHVAGNAKASDLELSEEDMRKIDQAYPFRG